MIDAVIFDMDGLLIDSEPVWDAARARMAAEHSQEWTSDDHHQVMGVSTAFWVAYMRERLALPLGPEEVEKRIINTMVEMYRERIPWHAGAVSCVALAAEHFPCGLASGSPRLLIDTVTQSPELHGALQLQVILSADEVARGKPEPDVYLETAARLGVKPERCVCLEDSSSGILAGAAAGMKVIAVPDERFPPRAEALAKADVVLSSLTEVTLSMLQHPRVAGA